MKLSEILQVQRELEDKIRSAFFTLQRMPNEELKYLRAGERCCWPQFVQDWQAYGATAARAPRIHPSPDAIDNMERMIGALAWLATQNYDEAKIISLCFGLRQNSAVVAKIMGVSKDTVQRKRKAGMLRLAYHILGINKKAA